MKVLFVIIYFGLDNNDYIYKVYIPLNEQKLDIFNSKYSVRTFEEAW